MSGYIHAFFVSLMSAIGFGNPQPAVYQGYGEGDYVLVAPQIPGTLETLEVARGDTVHAGAALFTLEHVYEQAAVDQAKAQAFRADATLADLIKARRQPELDQLVAARDEATAAVQIAEITFARDQKQIKAQAISQAAFDTDKATLEQARARLAEAEAALATGQLSTGRDDAIHAAQADIVAAQAALAQAQWRLNQKKLETSSDAFVFDTLYRPGEYINAGQPVVSLLPAANIRVRFFVPATALPNIPMGSHVSVRMTGDDKDAMPAHVTYISPQAEYSPPELYNRDNREKLLFMLEATPDKTPERIHPGLPVDVAIDKAEHDDR